MKKFILNTSSGSFLIDASAIVRVQASSNYSKIFFSDGKMLLTAKLLSWFEGQLQTESFTRLHRSHLINNRYLHLHKCSSNSVELLNGKIVPVSRRRKKTVLQKLAAACTILFSFSYAGFAQTASISIGVPHASAAVAINSINKVTLITTITTMQIGPCVVLHGKELCCPVSPY